jgi:hypothetical protein
MYMKSSIIVLAAIAELVVGHGAIVKATGDQGGEGTALGGKSTSPIHHITQQY